MSETINPNARAIQQEQDVYINYVTKYGETPAQVEKLATWDNLHPTLYVFSIKESDIPTLTYDGATFDGWYTTETYDEGTKVEVGSFEFDNGTTSITFYAKWSITVKTAMTNIANPIRNLLNTTNTLTIDNMNTNLDTTIAAVSDMKAALTERGISVSSANTIGDVKTLVSGIAGKYPNGTSWTQSNSATGLQPNKCVYGNGIWVACDCSTGLYYSTDGKIWTQSNITSGNFGNCINANGIWVAFNYDTGLYYSTDGMIWNTSNVTNKKCHCCAYANGLWVAYTPIYGFYYSTDGMTWTRTNQYINGGMYDLNYANGIWVGCGYGIHYSIDGKTWTKSNITSRNFYYSTNANGIWVACERQTFGLYYSTDGKTWTQSNITNINCYQCAYANGVWVACTGKGLYYSTDGMVWTQSNVTYSFCWCTNANGIWVACSNSTKGIYYSIDGKTWVASNIKSGAFYHCTNANGIWVTSGENDLYYSVTWEP